MVSRNLDRVSKAKRPHADYKTRKLPKSLGAAGDILRHRQVGCKTRRQLCRCLCHHGIVSRASLLQSQRNDMSRCCALLLVPGCLLSAPDTQGGGARSSTHSSSYIGRASSVVGGMDSDGGGRGWGQGSG